MGRYNYVNNTIRDYFVEKRIDDKHFQVKCVNCGIYKTVTMQTLRDGIKNKGNCCVCECTRTGIKPGDKFNRLTVIKRNLEPAENTKGRISFYCRCDCGNITSVIGTRLKSGTVKSCGCLSKEKSKENIQLALQNLEDLTGQKSGKLTVLRLALPEEVVNRPSNVRYWLCECECGNSHIVSTSDFKMKKVQSCGCLNSKGEALISKILENNNINYAKQFYFNDLKSEQGRKFYFDFGILNSNNELLYLIEYDGVQHFSKNCQFSKKEKELSLQQVQLRDSVKNDYCFSHNIPLIRIPYNYFEKITIEDLLLESTNFLIERKGDENGT